MVFPYSQLKYEEIIHIIKEREAELIKGSENEISTDKVKTAISGLSRNRKLIITIFLVCFVLLFVVQNIVFLKADTHPQGSDSHFQRSLLYYDQLFNNIESNLWELSYPPLFFLLPQPLYKIMGLTTDAPRVALTLLSIIFLLAMFGIGYELGGAYSGAAVISIAASSPLILNLSRRYMPEFPQTAVTALCFYLLLKSKGYKQRLPSIFLGIAMAASFMIKWSSAFFLFLPVLWFLIPNIFHSKKSILTFIAFLVPASISGLGMMWFYKKIAPHTFLKPMELLKFYIPIILIPAIIASVIMFFLDRKFKKMENYCSSGVCSIINFAFSSVIFALLTSPWFFWAGRAISFKYEILMAEPRRLEENLRSLKYIFTDGFNFSIPLIIVGLVFLFISRKDLFRRLVVPANILILAPAMYWVTYSDYRYLLSFEIFLAALAGFWVCETGRFKSFITAGIMAISIISMLAWSVIPGNLPIFQPVGPLLVSFPPKQNLYNIAPAIDFLARSEGSSWKKMTIYEKKNPPFDNEYVQFEAFKRGNRILPLIRYNEQDDGYRFVKDFENLKQTSTLVEPYKIDMKFCEKLKTNNRKIYPFIRSKLPALTLKSLSEWNPGRPITGEMQNSITETINSIINGEPIYDKDLFSDIPLHQIARRRAEEGSHGVQLPQMNKILLNEAFDHSLMSGFEEDQWKDLNDVEDVIILHNEKDSIDFIVQTIKKAYPDVKFEGTRFPVGAKYYMTVFKLKRGER